MDIGGVIGSIVSTQKVESFKGMKLCVVQPLDENLNPTGSPIICSDHTAQMGEGELVFFVTSGDATQADPYIDTPSDAAIVGIVDTVDAPIKLTQKVKQPQGIPVSFPEHVYQKKK
jgi:ethanolamine utilization protein EutN